MAFSGIAHEQRLHMQPGTKRSFHHPDSLDTYKTVIARFARKGETESLEPAIIAAGDRFVLRGRGLARACLAVLGHAQQRSKPLPAGKARVAGDFAP
jgi:hypothetical protein